MTEGLPQAEKLLALTGLDQVLHVHHTAEEGLAATHGAGPPGAGTADGSAA